MKIKFRNITDNDLPLLQQIYRSTREEELALTDWDETQKTAFIQQQFSAQHSYYKEVYHDATFEIIVINNIDAGRLYRWESEKQLRIVDIALLPEFRNMGAGNKILDDLILQTENSGKILSIHVEYFSRALNLYKRKGFEIKDQTGVYYYMERGN